MRSPHQCQAVAGEFSRFGCKVMHKSTASWHQLAKSGQRQKKMSQASDAKLRAFKSPLCLGHGRSGAASRLAGEDQIWDSDPQQKQHQFLLIEIERPQNIINNPTALGEGRKHHGSFIILFTYILPRKPTPNHHHQITIKPGNPTPPQRQPNPHVHNKYHIIVYKLLFLIPFHFRKEKRTSTSTSTSTSTQKAVIKNAK